jgi:glycosyltransferase involved in cell wall biosynthesis
MTCLSEEYSAAKGGKRRFTQALLKQPSCAQNRIFSIPRLVATDPFSNQMISTQQSVRDAAAYSRHPQTAPPSVLLIGAIHRGQAPRGGEEYKNQLLLGYLGDKTALTCIDTHRWKQNPGVLMKLLWKVFFGTFDTILISASSATTYRLIQMMHLRPSLLSKTIYLVVGGYFPGAVVAGKFRAKYYRRLKGILVQGRKMQRELSAAGLKEHVAVMPNFKPVAKVFGAIGRFAAPVFRFVFLSRISPEKGVLELFQAIRLLKGKRDFIVDFYGPVEAGFQQDFDKLLTENTGCTYRGYLDFLRDPEGAYTTLADYHTMVFPTFWQGEGFPGVVLDAYIAGLPVIASDWNLNAEVLSEGKTGLLVPPRDAAALALAMDKMMDEREKQAVYSAECHRRALDYTVDRVLDTYLMPYLNNSPSTLQADSHA